MALISKLTAIGDAIRAKTGGTEKMTLDQMATEIEGIQTGGTDENFIKLVTRPLRATEITLPQEVTSIGRYAFYSASYVTSVNMPNVTYISPYAFYGCDDLALTSLPSGVTYLGENAFRGCTSLALLTLPDALTGICKYAFSGCKKLAITSIPSGVNYIEDSAFQTCTGLTSITFKGTPTSTINSYAFSSCTNLKTINVPWAEGEVANAPWGATNATINYNYTGE